MSERRIVGVMSGTSLDGVDAACCLIRSNQSGYEVTVESSFTRVYDSDLRERIERVCSDEGTVAELCDVNVALGVVFADAAISAVAAADVTLADVDAIGSHGQTVRHHPEPRVMGDERLRSTLQIGDASVIAERTGVTTIADFRTADIAAGGHGAPLVPFADLALLADETEFRIAQNIGGIANCTALPPGANRADVIAFDTGPGNVVIDGVVKHVTDGELTYDQDGRLARDGAINNAVCEEFLDDPYFRANPPKSTGRERFGGTYVREFIDACRARSLTSEEMIATATALTARSIADAYQRFLPVPDEVVLSGGGARNHRLVELLETHVEAPVRPIDEYGIGAGEKEAVAFALLAAAALEGIPNNIPSATGATHPVVLGTRAPPIGFAPPANEPR